MGTLTVNAINGQTVAAGASYVVPFPAGKSAGNYSTTGAKLTTGDGSVYPVTVSFGASGITVTNPTGRDIASGQFDFLDLQTSGILARFNSSGYTEVLIGPKNTEAGLVSATIDPVTGVVELLAGSTSLGSAGSTYTWALKPLASILRGQIFISDVGVGGSYWYSDGSKWRPVGGRVTLKNTIVDITNNGAPKVVLDYATIPAGLWLDGDVIECEIVKERTGGTADTDATDLMLGTVANTPGTSTGLSTSALATTNLTFAGRFIVRKDSATLLRPLAIAGSVGMGASTAANVAVTVANMDTQTTYLQVTSDLTTAGGEVAHLRGFVVTLISGS